MLEWFELGYLGLFLACFLAATVLPFSSEAFVVAMLIAGYDTIMVVILATIGNWVGGMTSYALGYIGNWYWIETKLKVSKKKIEGLKNWIDKYGVYSAFMCWLPFVGDPLAVTLGFFRIDRYRVTLFMLIGKFLRYYMLVVLYNS